MNPMIYNNYFYQGFLFTKFDYSFLPQNFVENVYDSIIKNHLKVIQLKKLF